MAKEAFQKMKTILTDRKMSTHTKDRMLQCYIYSVLTYGSERWTISPTMEKRLEAAELWFYRILRLTSMKGTNMLGRFFGKVLGFTGFTIQYGCIAHCTFEYLGEIVMCSGPSMEPTLKASDVIISEKLSRHFYRIEKGDVIIAVSPNDPKMNICKRVIGLEGDKIYTSGPLDAFKTQRYVPRGHVWLEGDNLQNSTDSRNYGPIPYALIKGRVCLKIWPPHEFGFLRKSPNQSSNR
ncbi:mitochondrial inner membrane protease subunit 1 isoform X2 [Mobula birostris]|uniref:mitochondrial inner membrane protease subunit 1 isoform X2 n=1 Tax=Mobula birostris TaxID=1983395 RepID=UPI003B27D285